MIVKDEEHIIEDALTCLAPHISYWVICDTGSSDKTVETIEMFMSTVKIPGVLKKHEWKDFGTNRSLALHEAWSLRDVHKCEYMFTFDADDVIQGDFTLPEVMNADGYFVQFGASFAYNRMCIFRCSPDLHWKYKGVLHEYPTCENKDNVTTDTIRGNYYIESRRLGARSNDKHKYLKDAQNLETAITTETDEGMRIRYTFYAAQSYYDAGMHDHAISLYTQRMKMQGWFEEVFCSALRVAMIMELKPSVYSEYDVQRAYLRAFQEDVERAEPLYYLCKYFRVKDRFKEGYAFGKLASTINMPSSAKLFMHRDVYSFKIKDELSICAFWTNRKEECKALCIELLQLTELSTSDRERISKNLSFC